MSGVDVGGRGDADVGGAVSDCVGLVEIDADGAGATADVAEPPWVEDPDADGPEPGLEVAGPVAGREAPVDSGLLGGRGAAAGTVGAAVRPWLLVLVRPASGACEDGVGTRTTVGTVVRAGPVGGRSDRLTAPTARMLTEMIAAASAVRTIHRVRRNPDFSVGIGRSGFDREGSARSVS